MGKIIKCENNKIKKVKVNGVEIVGKYFAYDKCHKIYIIEDKEDMKQAKKYGYSIYCIAYNNENYLEQAYNNSCELRFISNWKLDKQYVKQFENANFEMGC